MFDVKRVMGLLKKYKPSLRAIWTQFRRLPHFIQLLFVFPVVCGIALAFVVGNMGLALMGTAVAINALFAGWIGGAIVLILGKASIIVAKDRWRSR